MRFIAQKFLNRAEARVGVTFDYLRYILSHSVTLLVRLNRIFGFLDPNGHAPPLAYHAARLRGALSADCGTCVQAEINLAKNAGLSADLIHAILCSKLDALDEGVAAVVVLSDAVTSARQDDPDARAQIVQIYGDKALIELAYAMSGAALLPSIKRATGFATTCDPNVMKL